MAHVRTSRWRWVRRGVVALCVGVVVTYLSAWIPTVILARRPAAAPVLKEKQVASVFGDVGRRLERLSYSASGATMCEIKAENSQLLVRFDEGPPKGVKYRYRYVDVLDMSAIDVQSWMLAYVPRRPLLQEESTDEWILWKQGWPFRGISGGVRRSTKTEYSLVVSEALSAVPFPWTANGWRHPLAGLLVLPLRPDLPVFASNVAFYAAILSPVIWWRSIKRWNRVRRSRCGACGYDVKGIAGGVCPECGSPTPPGS